MSRAFAVVVDVVVVLLVLVLARMRVEAANSGWCPFAPRDVDVASRCRPGADATRADDALASFRSCASCAYAYAIEAYAIDATSVAGDVTRACALKAIGSIENLTIRANALTFALACDDELFERASARMTERYTKWIANAPSARCGRRFPMDEGKVRHAMWARAGATASTSFASCLARCERLGRAKCDGASFCDAWTGGGCGVDVFVAPYDVNACLLFRFREEGDRAKANETEDEDEGREGAFDADGLDEGGSWCNGVARDGGGVKTGMT